MELHTAPSLREFLRVDKENMALPRGGGFMRLTGYYEKRLVILKMIWYAFIRRAIDYFSAFIRLTLCDACICRLFCRYPCLISLVYLTLSKLGKPIEKVINFLQFALTKLF